MMNDVMTAPRLPAQPAPPQPAAQPELEDDSMTADMPQMFLDLVKQLDLGGIQDPGQKVIVEGIVRVGEQLIRQLLEKTVEAGELAQQLNLTSGNIPAAPTPTNASQTAQDYNSMSQANLAVIKQIQDQMLSVSEAQGMQFNKRMQDLLNVRAKTQDISLTKMQGLKNLATGQPVTGLPPIKS